MHLDFGKEQYGGSFMTENVHDVKTFFWLLLFLLSLFGYHVAGDGFAVANFMQTYSCPSLIVLALLAFYPSFVSSRVVLLSIPMIQLCPKLHKFVPNMLK